jgi:glycosyltransferase involved in cell wall biosynthesis
MKQVVILQNSLPHYRVPFFQGLRERLLEENIELRLIHGYSKKGERFNSVLSWAEPFERLPRIGKLVCHPVLRPLVSADLVIVEDAAKFLTNYVAFVISVFGKTRIAFWGHGRNHQAQSRNSFSERLKTWLGKRSDWYFAYTSDVRDELIDRGFDGDRITDVQNAIAATDGAIDQHKVDQLRRELSISPNAIVVIYCGRMYPIKQLNYLIEAAPLVFKWMPEFRLVLAGGGVDQHLAEEAARKYDYVDYVGPVFDEHKSALFGLSRMWVMPGSVGLGILDAFQNSTPPIVVRHKFHSPEIAYLQNGENGLSVEDSPEGIAEGILTLGTDSELYARLQTGSRLTAAEITIDSMVERFASGIVQALETPH